MTIYIIGSLANPRIPELAKSLRLEGWTVLDDWYSAGIDADTCWREHEQLRGRSYRDALDGEHARNVFEFDKRLLDSADVAVLVLPAGKSGFAELGYMRGSRKHTIAFIDGPEPERWDIMLRFADNIVVDEAELLVALYEKETWGVIPMTFTWWRNQPWWRRAAYRLRMWLWWI